MVKSSKNFIEKINILLAHANIEDANTLLRMKDFLDTADTVPLSLMQDYDRIENNILENVSSTERASIIKKLVKLKSNFTFIPDIDNTLMRRMDKIENQITRIIEQPRLFERNAQQKLDQIDEKFALLMNINDKHTSVTDQISKVDYLEKQLEKLKTDAQDLLNDISTVQLAKQYLEAKNTYGWHYNRMKFSRNKKWYLRWLMNFWYFLVYIKRNIFQKDLFLYICFLLSLLLLTCIYILLILSNSVSYKDLVFTIPMIWAAWFFQRKINTREKLYEVYNHKQKVMETYVAFKNGSYNFGAADKMEEALLEAVKKDPSDCIGKDNTTLVESILDKIKGIFVSERIKKSIKYDPPID